ncbi:hypothetical protein DBIPINDM_001574 [Mesorhizobium sp. AR02]|uniref:hypothetical protein n=1 Tax=Mesorhizobium sp. AR02 TaxID=2865837 RepID=UPI0021610AE6|nr:hypothetical protein [Mesorhizobium sp. AR02]UVK55084.1 hypothetical protein DBIPINDM_001574 [Mesorhizobium sp. AR02]
MPTGPKGQKRPADASADDPSLPLATHQGKMTVGSLDLDCYVLEDGRRLFHKRGMARALDMKSGGGNVFMRALASQARILLALVNGRSLREDGRRCAEAGQAGAIQKDGLKKENPRHRGAGVVALRATQRCGHKVIKAWVKIKNRLKENVPRYMLTASTSTIQSMSETSRF